MRIDQSSSVQMNELDADSCSFFLSCTGVITTSKHWSLCEQVVLSWEDSFGKLFEKDDDLINADNLFQEKTMAVVEPTESPPAQTIKTR
jgi:hypothetical protein